MHAARAVVTGIGIGVGVMRQAEQEAALDARDLLRTAALQRKTIELSGLAAGIGEAVGRPGHRLRVVEGEAEIGQSKPVLLARHSANSSNARSCRHATARPWHPFRVACP